MGGEEHYFTVEVYGARAWACAEHLAKGSRVVVEAELDWPEWTDQENNRREAVALKGPPDPVRGNPAGGSDADEGGVDQGSAPSDAEPVGAGSRRVDPARAVEAAGT
jgi:single-stranded DNA-binding protein